MSVATMLLRQKIMETLEGLRDGTVSPEDASGFMAELYEGLIGNYREAIKLIPDVIVEKASKDVIVPLLLSMYKILSVGLRDKEVVKASKEYTVLLAKRRAKALKTYTDAGFTREEAMAFVLQDAANAKAFKESIIASAKKND